MLLGKKTILLFFLINTFGLAFGQRECVLRFSGTIINQSGEGVGIASLLLLSDSTLHVSDGDGNFVIKDLCPGHYTVLIRAAGYDDTVVDVDLNRDISQKISLKDAVTQLDEVVVEDKILNTEHALNFSVLTEKQLSETAGKSLGESLKEIPGVNSIQAGPGIFKPVIHGVHSQRVLILNYGIRQEGQQWGAEHAPEIDPMMASNIVVIKDASSIKYGTDAIGGVVVVNPAPLPLRGGIGGSVNTILQSNGRSGTLSAMLEGGIGKREGWGWRAQGTGRRAGDFHTPDYSLTNSGLQELNYSAATGYRNERFGLELFFSHFSTELGILKGTSIGNIDDLLNAIEREPPQYTSGFSYDIGEPRQEVKHDLLKLTGNINNEKSVWRFQYGFQNNSRKEFDIRKGDRSKIPAIDLQLATHTLDAEWQSTSSEKFSVSAGVTGMLQNNKNIPGTEVIPFIPNFSSQSGGAFVITKLSSARWIVDVGARYDFRHYAVSGYDVNNALYRAAFDFQNVSATAGATRGLRKDESIKFNLSSSWRPPHVAELYSLGTHQSAAAIEYGLLLNDSTSEIRDLGDVNFKNEQAFKFVTTYDRQWKSVHVELSGYVNYIANYIYLKPSGITQNVRGVFPYFLYTQTDALFLGADLSGSWQATTHLSVIPKVSLLRASDHRNSDYLVFIPSNRYEIALRYEGHDHYKLDNFYIESKTKYVDQQRRAPRVVTVREIKEAYDDERNIFQENDANFDFTPAPSGYFLWNLSTGSSVRTNSLKYDLRLTAENVLNTSYREYTNRFRYYADDLGRNFMLSVKCIF
jgi:iron complex outermembrane receptor protein